MAGLGRILPAATSLEIQGAACSILEPSDEIRELAGVFPALPREVVNDDHSLAPPASQQATSSLPRARKNGTSFLSGYRLAKPSMRTRSHLPSSNCQGSRLRTSSSTARRKRRG